MSFFSKPIGRLSYFLTVFIVGFLGGAASFVLSVQTQGADGKISFAVTPASMIVSVIVFVIYVIMTSKRLRDINPGASAQWFLLVPIANYALRLVGGNMTGPFAYLPSGASVQTMLALMPLIMILGLGTLVLTIVLFFKKGKQNA